MNPEHRARWMGLYAGVIFGIYWIPLRYLDAAGLDGPWATVLFSAVPVLLLLPLVLIKRHLVLRASWRFHLTSILLGLSFVLYATAFNYTEVVRAMLMFYLMPVWGFLIARVVIKEAITPVRWLSIVIGLSGMAIVLGMEGGFPLPRNLGDWMGLLSGVIWAVGSLQLLLDEQADAMGYTCTALFWGAIWSATIAFLMTIQGQVSAPSFNALPSVLPWFVPFALFVLITGMYAVIYSGTVLNPGVIGILFMIEVVVATITAALFAGEPFGLRHATGVLLVCLAGILEPLVNTIHARR